MQLRLTKQYIASFIYNSNGIEGLYVPEGHVLKILKGEYEGKSPLILNHIKAIDYIKANKKKKPTIETIRELHEILLRDVDAWAGIIRPDKVFISGREAPDHKELVYLLECWIGLWGKKPREDWDQGKAALFRHYEFEYIHPFYDGNGRVGRLLLLWDCLHHKVKVDMIKCENKLRFKYYNSIDKYVRQDREREFLKDWR